MLDAKVLESLPTWWRNIDKDKQYLVLGDDMDSWLSCCYLQRKFKGLQIGGFYDFKKGLYLNKEIAEGKEPIYVDCSMKSGKCFDNHKTIFVEDNPEMINPNKPFIGGYYSRKYNGSVMAFLLGLYDEDMSKYNKEALSRLLCIDSFFKGVYKSGGKYAEVNYTWFNRLGMLDVLKPITDELNESDFTNQIDEEVLYRHFHIDEDGYIKVVNAARKMKDIPYCKFELVMPVQQGRTSPQCSEKRIRELVEEQDIVSLSQVYEGTYQYSYRNI